MALTATIPATAWIIPNVTLQLGNVQMEPVTSDGRGTPASLVSATIIYGTHGITNWLLKPVFSIDNIRAMWNKYLFWVGKIQSLNPAFTSFQKALMISFFQQDVCLHL